MQISVLPLGSLDTNCYVVTDEKTNETAVIDPGDDGERLAETLGTLGLRVKFILLTHGHYDHVGGVKALREATGAPVYLHAADLTLPGTITHGPLVYTNTYADGDSLALGSVRFAVLHTPGHTPGSVCLLAGDDVLFSGDTLFAGSCGRTDLPGGSMDDMLASLKKLAALPGDRTVYPGHGDNTTLGLERENNVCMLEACGR
jgi:hydroxyacylglutathione hydrolase